MDPNLNVTHRLKGSEDQHECKAWNKQITSSINSFYKNKQITSSITSFLLKQTNYIDLFFLQKQTNNEFFLSKTNK